MRMTLALVCLVLLADVVPTCAAEPAGTVLLDDAFDRQEQNPELEQVGNGWGTNSKSRAQGVKQVDLVDGAMHIQRADVADHGVSVTHDLAFTDAVISLRFKIGKQDDLGINIADMREKSVHAGHLCVARIRPKQVQISDLKTGTMDLATRQRRQAGTQTDADKARIKQKSKTFQVDLAGDEWHDLEVRIVGETMSVSIDGEQVGAFESEGIAHPTKSRLRLAVNKSAWVDDVKVVRLK